MKRVSLKGNKKYDVRCDRRHSVLGNPFIMGKHGNREQVIERYKKWLWEAMKVVKELERLSELDKDLILACHCREEDNCHVDVIIAAVDYLRKEKG